MPKAPERDDALDAIESTGATALAEMRRLLHMLRADDEDVALAPQPSLAQLEQLVAQVRDAGLPVELHIEGERRELPPGVDVSAYRIVQEALTNALKHAGPAQRARLGHASSPDALELEIADTGAGADERRRRRTRPRRHARTRRRRSAASSRAGRAPEGGFAIRCAAAAVIRVLLADDQRLVRSGFRMILGADPSSRSSARRTTASRRSPRRATLRAGRRADGRAHAACRRDRGDAADLRDDRAAARARPDHLRPRRVRVRGAARRARAASS